MSRGRPSNASRAGSTAASNEQVMTSVWHGLVDTLRLLPTVPHAKPLTDEERTIQLRRTVDEKATLDQALEKLSTLIALRKGESVPPESLPPGTTLASSTTGTGGSGGAAAVPVVSVSTPGSTGGVGTPGSTTGGGGAGGLKRKRRLSQTLSPAPPLSQASAISHTAAGATASVSGGAESTASPVSVPRSGTPLNRDAAGRQRKEMYHDQLPLKPGRKVAFKVPQKGKTEEGTEEEWILATVKANVDKDKMRYEVQDADDASTSWKTTLRSIIPLPNPDAPPSHSSHPSNLENIPRGSTVLGLYPETTSFYRATVVFPPLPGPSVPPVTKGGNNPKPDPKAEKKPVPGRYLLTFVDDNGLVHEVEKEFVVLFPQ